MAWTVAFVQTILLMLKMMNRPSYYYISLLMYNIFALVVQRIFIFRYQNRYSNESMYRSEIEMMFSFQII